MNKFWQFVQTQLMTPFLKSFQRFPETVTIGLLIMVLMDVSLMDLSHIVTAVLDEIIPALWIALIYSAGWKLWIERHPSTNMVRWIGDNVIVAGAIIYYFAAQSAANELIEMSRFSALLGIGVLGFFIAPYYLQRKGLAHYSLHVVTKFLVTAFYSGVIWLGISAILVTIEGLFRVIIPSDTYGYIFATILGLITIPVFLGLVPSSDESFENVPMNKIWKTVFVTIIVPLLFVFTVILVVYLLTQLLPSSSYEPMVYLGSALALAIVGSLMLVLTEGVAAEYPHIHFFVRYWPWALAFVMVGYYVEGFRGAFTNGFATVHAFFLFLGLFPIGVLVTHFKWSTLRPILTMLVAVDTLTLAFIAPFINAFAITRYVVAAEWKTLLVTNNMWVDNEIVPNPSASTTLRGQFSHILTRASEVGFDSLIGLPDNFNLMDSEAVLGFEFDSSWNPMDQVSYHNLGAGDTTVYLPAGDYELVAFINGVRSLNIDDYVVTYNALNEVITLTETSLLLTIDLEDITGPLKANSLTAEYVTLPIDDLTFTFTEGTTTVVLAIGSISFTYDPEDSSYKLTHWNALLGIIRQ